MPSRIAFGHFGAWEQQIRTNVGTSYEVHFVDLDQVTLDDFDAIVPLQLAHYEALDRRPDLLGQKFFHPSADVIERCDDKLMLTSFLIDMGLAEFAPPFQRAGPPYPYLRKQRRGAWGAGSQVVEGPQDELGLDGHDDSLFRQALILGNVEHATHILRVDGEVRYASTFTHTMAGPAVVLGAEHRPLRTTFMRGCPHLDLFSDVLEQLGYEGTACFDYKTVDERPVILEINPRYGGSLNSDVSAYLDAYVEALA